MNPKPDISIIVPCYQAERYLDRCLGSLRIQKTPEAEFILIDDGSTDATPAILDAFAREEPRARVIHTNNRGVSAARNQGIDLACGARIAFVDADDLLEQNALDILWRGAMRSGAQIVSACHTLFDVATNRRIPIEFEAVPQQPSEIVREIIHMHRIYNNLWNKLYDRALFDGLRLDEDVRIGEDALLNLQLYHRAKRVAYLPESTYVYRVHDASAMASIHGYSDAHQPMLRSMSRILTREGIKELYFRDFLGSCVWIDEKEKGIRRCMRGFNARIRPLVLEDVCGERIPQPDRGLYRSVCRGTFPARYILQRVGEKLTGRKKGFRR